MKLNRIFRICKEIQIKYLLHGSIVRVQKGGKLEISRGTSVKNCSIFISKDSRLTIATGASVSQTNISISKGYLEIGAYSIIECKTAFRPFYSINGGVTIGHHTRMRCTVWVRFGGRLSIGCYTNINEDSEIRVDESMTIGSYNQISYHVMLWDTNTHTLYAREKRRELAISGYPEYGTEIEKPKSAPVIIGDDCWIGREAVLLKGTCLGDAVVVGFRTVLTGQVVASNQTVIQDVLLKNHPNNI